MSVPTGEIKKIADFGVFIVTTLASIFAYIWMYIVLQMWTPGVITIEEGSLTFFFFFLLILLAYGADKWNEMKTEENSLKNQTQREIDGIFSIVDFYNATMSE